MKRLFDLTEICMILKILAVVLIFLISLSWFVKTSIQPRQAVKVLVERANTIDALDDKILKYNEEVIIYNDNLLEGQKKKLKR